MASRKPTVPPPAKFIAVDALKHADDKRRNIPTAEYQSLMADEASKPVQVSCPRGNSNTDRLQAKKQQRKAGYRSPGLRPVCLASRASIFGPISSPSWKANTTSGQPGRAKVLCEPVCRFTCQPSRCSAASTRRALAEGQTLTLRQAG